MGEAPGVREGTSKMGTGKRRRVWFLEWFAVVWGTFVYAVAFTYIGLLAILVAEAYIGQGRAGKGHPSAGLRAAASLFHSWWPDSMNKWVIQTTERSYAGDCRLFTWEKPHKMSNLKDTLMDEFVLAHLLGWWGKAIIFRNRVLLWMLSIGFELCEFCLKNVLPNFQECWWDALILDILVCNWIGMELGMLTLTLAQLPKYNWCFVQKFFSKMADSVGYSSLMTKNGQAALDRLAVHLDDFCNYFAVPTLICLCTLYVELLGFFLKSLLQLQPLHPFNTVRLVLWAATALPALYELQNFVAASQAPIGRKMGQGINALSSGFFELSSSYMLCLVNMALAESMFVLSCTQQ